MQALRFEGTGKEYFKIWIVNILLIIVTLGFYYPWAKVRTKRYFYANTLLQDRNFEYHATGKQLFWGFLIAVALFAVYNILQSVFPLGGALLAIVFVAALPWIIWRSMKFNMLMTSFSNVRFGFAGDLKQSYMNFFAYPLVLYIGLALITVVAFFLLKLVQGMTVLSLIIVGIGVLATLAYILYALSFLKKKNTEYLINGTRYGQGKFSTEIELKQLMKIALKAILLGVLLYIAINALVMLFVGLLVLATGGMESLQIAKPDAANILGSLMSLSLVGRIFAGVLGVLFYIAIIYLGTLAVAYYSGRNRNYIYGNTKLDEKITFASTLRTKPYAWIMMTNFLAVIFTIGLAYPWAKVRMTRYMLEHTEVNTEAGFDEYVSEKQKTESSLGDQIGDAFNVDVGIGF